MAIARFHRVSPAQYQAGLALHHHHPAAALPLEALPLPCRATPHSAGYDFFSPVDGVIPPGGTLTVPTGIRAAMEPGWVLLIVPRSSLGIRHHLHLPNTLGVIDGDYFHADNEGHLFVPLHNRGDAPFHLAQHMRFCQGIFLPYGLAEEDAPQGARTGGFGSTGE